MKIRILLFLTILLTSSCASNVYVKTEVAPRVFIQHGTTFFVLILDRNTIEEQKALARLETKLEHMGYYTTTNISESEYCFVISMDNPSYSSTYSMPITSPSTTNYSGTVGNTYYSGSATTYNTTYVPVTSTYSFKKNYLYLYKYNKSTKKNRLIWSSFTSIDSNLYKTYEDQIMEIIVGLLGKNFDGNIQLKQ